MAAQGKRGVFQVAKKGRRGNRTSRHVNCEERNGNMPGKRKDKRKGRDEKKTTLAFREPYKEKEGAASFPG